MTPPVTAAQPRPPRPPHAAPGQSAVVIQDPPLGLPAKMHTWLTERYKGPWANVQTWTEAPDHPRDPGSFPFVEVYGPDVRVQLDKPNGRKGAIAWNCDSSPGTIPP